MQKKIPNLNIEGPKIVSVGGWGKNFSVSDVEIDESLSKMKIQSFIRKQYMTFKAERRDRVATGPVSNKVEIHSESIEEQTTYLDPLYIGPPQQTPLGSVRRGTLDINDITSEIPNDSENNKDTKLNKAKAPDEK